MDVVKFKAILETMHKVGIEAAIFEPDENGTKIRGADKNRKVVVFDTIDEELVTATLAIQSVRGILSRLSLFDLEKASVEMDKKSENGEEFVVNFSLKQGKRKGGYKCANPDVDSLGVPKYIPNIDPVASINFTAEYTEYVLQAMQSLSITGDKDERYVEFESTSGELVVKIYDGEDDSFNDSIEDVVDGEDVSSKWEIDAIQRMIKVNTDGGKTGFEFGITENGIGLLDMGEICVMVVPM